MPSNTKRVQFVVKSSKFCNLRCRYCYEYSELGNRAAIAPEQLDKMYSHIASYYSQLDHPTEIEFVWHGGEPLLQSPDYYWQTFDRQQEIFGELASSVTNIVQTNLTVLNKERIQLLRDGFDGVGVSVDLFGGLRTNQAGMDSQTTVLKNMDRLRDENIPYGCITVLTKLNLPYIQKIYKFFEKMNLSFRLLPLFNGAFDGQHKGFEINANEVLSAFCTLVDLWMEGDRLVVVQPIMDHIQQILHYYSPDSEPFYYDKKEWESIYLVNVTGDVYSYADAYNIEFSHGNLFKDSMEEIVLGSAHQKVIKAAEERIASTCTFCPYFGSCSGYPVAEEGILHNQVDDKGNMLCIKERGLLQHIEMRLKQAGIIDSATGKLNIKHRIPSKSIPALDCPL
ncbi:radical SAM protein [Hassallia byssoidea VB512170]|uniref:Radical SAM protein n=1 Tax=Hassallia byssoidea VB512170 TaxID=1304833 RepID=A0A846HF46_9CYAN|nr:radical SAM protein [Hassalia byssoidea]NEU75081.1 radical SAM protein [Hassalia byssoidea VB512170]